jgi:hypothetical protein
VEPLHYAVPASLVPDAIVPASLVPDAAVLGTVALLQPAPSTFSALRRRLARPTLLQFAPPACPTLLLAACYSARRSREVLFLLLCRPL